MDKADFFRLVQDCERLLLRDVVGERRAFDARETQAVAQRARTATAGNFSSFSSVAVDSWGNVYAAGSINGTGICDFGEGITATGTANSDNAVLVKYDSLGKAQWARTVTASPD